MLAEFAGLVLDIPEGWGDISADLPSDAPPTLAREAGVGALQFSIARYQSGVKPTVDENALTRLFVDFCRNHLLDGIEPSVLSTGKSLCIGGVSICAEEVVAVWYVSNGSDVGLVTYIALRPDDPVIQKELCEARAIVDSIEFAP